MIEQWMQVVAVWLMAGIVAVVAGACVASEWGNDRRGMACLIGVGGVAGLLIVVSGAIWMTRVMIR